MRGLMFRAFSSILLIAGLLGFGPSSSISSFAVEQSTADQKLQLSQLETEIGARVQRVEEFRFIRQEAARLGLRAWLFGGTAAGFAHYVKWDLQREGGMKHVQAERFDYDYTNIYRSTQDLDIVIDGSAEQAATLQSEISKKYPHLQGSKTAWEVRPLAQDFGDKAAILNNPDFLNQHTDSNSTGVIEITKPTDGDSIVRDVRDWNSKNPHFLQDVFDGSLHYYFSPLHETTKFAKEGRNPPILSAIRYLTKAFQYGLKIQPRDLEQIKKVIHDFNPSTGLANPYVSKWIEKNGKKLFQNAIDVEYAWNTLEEFGLRTKLRDIRGDTHVVDSLAWWMNKEPLRTVILGQGAGKTAKELGFDVIAHETKDFTAYENITSSYAGKPNAFISRKDSTGETAAHGDGFYAAIGRSGARKTGFTIRFHLDPGAREGTDFERFEQEGDQYLRIKNKAALSVIPESLNLTPLEYFELLGVDKPFFTDADHGIRDRLKRRIKAKAHALSESDGQKIADLVKKRLGSSHQWDLLIEWFALPISARYPEVVESLLGDQKNHHRIATYVLSQSHWNDRSDWVERLLQAGKADHALAGLILSQSHWKDRVRWVETLLEKGTVDGILISSVLSGPEWTDRLELIEELLPFDADVDIAEHILSKPYWKGRADWVEKLLNKRDERLNNRIIQYVLSQPHWQDHPEWVDRLLRESSTTKWSYIPAIAKYVLSQPHSRAHPEWMEKIIRSGEADYFLPEDLSLPHWQNHPELRRVAGNQEPTLENLRAAFKEGKSVNAVSSDACVYRYLTAELR